MLFCRHIIEDSSQNLKIAFHKSSTKNWSAFIRINGVFVVTNGQLFCNCPNKNSWNYILVKKFPSFWSKYKNWKL